MQLLNNGRRKIVFRDLEIQPGELFEIGKANGEQLISLFGDEIVVPTTKKVDGKDDEKIRALQADLDVARADLEAVKAERDELKQQVEALNADLEAVKAELKKATKAK